MDAFLSYSVIDIRFIFLCVKVLVSGNSSPSREVATILSTGKLFHIYFVDFSSGGVWVEECMARRGTFRRHQTFIKHFAKLLEKDTY